MKKNWLFRVFLGMIFLPSYVGITFLYHNHGSGKWTILETLPSSFLGPCFPLVTMMCREEGEVFFVLPMFLGVDDYAKS